jgi:hypothetical protein
MSGLNLTEYAVCYERLAYEQQLNGFSPSEAESM